MPTIFKFIRLRTLYLCLFLNLIGLPLGNAQFILGTGSDTLMLKMTHGVNPTDSMLSFGTQTTEFFRFFQRSDKAGLTALSTDVDSGLGLRAICNYAGSDCVKYEDLNSIADGNLPITGGTGITITNLSGNNTIALGNSGVTAGTYKSVTVDAKGRVTAGSNPTTLVDYGITDAVTNTSGVPSISAGTAASRPAFGTAGRLYIATDTNILSRDTGSSWSNLAGSVTSVSSANGDISVATSTTTPALTLNSGTSGGAGDANKIAKLSASGYLATGMLPAFSGGDVTSSAGSASLTLANSGVTASTYKSVTVDAKGRVTAGTNPTTLVGYGITDAVSNSLTSGQIFVGNGSNVATGVALSGDATISNTGALTLATVGVAKGGTGATTLTSGSLLVGNGTSAVTGLAGGTTGNVIYATGASTWASGTPNTAGLVDLTTTQTITGAKTFQFSANNLDSIASGLTIQRLRTGSVAPGALHGVALDYSLETATNNTLVTSGSIGSQWEVAQTDSTTQDAAMLFSTILDGTIAERMRISAAGLVGIKTSTPHTELEVNGKVLAGDYDAGISNAYTTGANKKIIIAGLPTDGTGSSNADNLIGLTLINRRNNTWTSGAVAHTIDFYSADASGAGAGVKAAIRTKYDNTTGASMGIAFSVDGGSGLTETARFHENGTLILGPSSFTGRYDVDSLTSKLNINTTATNQTLVYGKMISSHTGDLVKIQNSSNADLFLVDASANVYAKSGVFKFDTNKTTGSGVATLTANASSVNVTFDTAMDDTNYSLSIIPSYSTTVWYTNKATTGFTINVGTTNASNKTIDWSIRPY